MQHGKAEQLVLDRFAGLKGTVVLPGSKSLSNRALLLAALSTGTTVVENLLDSDDIRAMLGALKGIGISVDETERLTENRVVIQGNAGPFDASGREGAGELFLNNAGTAMRPLVAVVCACKGRFVLDGTARMRQRPIGDLIDALRQLGSSVQCTQNPPHGGCPPVTVDADGLAGGSCRISGKTSSQFLSALLMMSPLVKSGSVVVEVVDELVSKPYVDMTIGLMRKFGVYVEEVELSDDPNKPRPRYTVRSGQTYTSPGTYFIEGDASSASYFLAAGAILGGPVTVTGCGSESVQGDTKFAYLLERMGATVDWEPNSITVSRSMDGSQPLMGLDAYCGEIPDAAMTLATVALFVEDGRPTAIRNVYNWRVKESERMKAIVTELGKLGAEVTEGRDYCVIQPLKSIKPGVAIDTYDDHRMAMVFSLIACGASVIINDPGCTVKSFPTYFDELNKLITPQLAIKEIPVVGGSKVLIRPGLLDEIPEILAREGMRPSTYVIVSDDTVFGLYGQRLINAFARVGVTSAPTSRPRLLHFFFQHGEKSKTRETKCMVEDYMFEHKCQRDSCIIALGGGVVGDLSGFVAGTYMRGIPVVQVPTSTMAMIDSSIGGKTAINVPAGKNLIGVFNQPRMIFADPDLLKSLSRREVAEGLAEAIKMGCIRDAELFALMAGNAERLLDLDPELMQQVLYKAIAHKADVVKLDPKERGVRATLNFGHTIAHGVEGIKSPALLHGECVAIGAVAEAELASRMGKLPCECVGKIRACFEAYGLPVEVPTDITIEKMMDYIAVDKKNQGADIRCTIITDVGRSIDDPQPVPAETMRGVISDMITKAKAAQSPRQRWAAPLGARQGPLTGYHVVLVGMRAAGKSAMGRAVAKALGRHFVDLDEVLEKEVFGTSINTFVSAHGWPAFRSAEAQLLSDMVVHGKFLPQGALFMDGLYEAPRCIIATGGGIVETQAARDMLKQLSPVIFVDRHISDICLTLEGSGSYRPGLGTPPREVYAKRLQLYHECSNFIFTMREGEANWPVVNARFLTLVQCAEGTASTDEHGCLITVPITARDPGVAEREIEEAAAEGAGMVELRLDLLDGGVSAAKAALPQLMATARKVGLFVLVTFRPKWEDPNAGYTGDNAERFPVLQSAAAAGATYIDVEKKVFHKFLAAGGMPKGSSTQIVVSDHDFERTWDMEDLRRHAAEMRVLAGPRGVVKIAQMPTTTVEAARLMSLLSEAEGKPFVALAMGELGMFTRLLAPIYNAAFTFGCFSGRESAPGQPTIADMRDRYRVGSITKDTKVFGIFGDPVSHSRNPALHNRAFEHIGFDGVYVPLLIRGCSLEGFLAAMPQNLLGGASVTIPHKKAALGAAWRREPVAERIGEANTLVLEGTGSYTAYNTDWAAAVDACAAALGSEGSLRGATACVVGAGSLGRALAFGFLARGCTKVFIANRTHQRAVDLAKDIGGGCEAVTMEDLAAGRVSADVLANSSSVGMHPNEDQSPVPSFVLTNFKAVFDAVCTPRETKLLRNAAAKGCSVAEGLELFIGQAMAQFAFFTGKSLSPEVESLMRRHVIASMRPNL